jgi:hypothetical protein
MADDSRARRYRHLSTQLGKGAACDLLNKFQVLALTDPEAMREIEAFLDRSADVKTRQPSPRRHDTV